jgi:lipid II:glycine glycyltransferase (peptidoglycan interpeptide bridge formation enzyme)
VKKHIYANFSHIFHEYCLEQGIITEFVRFHPIIKNHNDYLAVGPEFNRNTICLDIFLGEGEVENLVSKMRNKVKAAIKNGLSVRVGDKRNLETLIQQYHNTMEKNVAEEYYFFPKEFFYSLVNILDDRNVTLLEVIYEDRVIASTIFLHYNEYVAYFLTGSDQEYLNLRPYNLLMSFAASKFKKEGYKFLHLGGGYSSNDELYRFKKTFTKKDPLDFYIGKKIHNQEVYQDLTKDLHVDANYFPLYRHPSIKKEEIHNL